MQARTFTTLLLAALALMAAGCNTVHGLGKDVERAGEVLQDSTKKK